MYCVYLTCYSGNKLPPFYIGSTSIKKINTGYRGSVESNRYKAIWDQELKENSTLFTTYIICIFDTRQEALDKEYKLQVALNILDKDVNKMYINQAVASVRGSFGRNTSGANNWNFGRTGELNSNYGNKWDDEKKKKVSVALAGVPKSEEHKEKLSIAKMGEKNPHYGKFGKDHPKFGKIESEETRKRKSISFSGANSYLFGIPKTKEQKERQSAVMTGLMAGEKHPNFGKIRITNDITSKWHLSSDPIPEGWHKGKAKMNSIQFPK